MSDLKQEFTYDDYQRAATKLFKKMFGKKTLKSIQKTEIKSFKWDDKVDIRVSEITVTTPSIKQRFKNIYEDDKDDPIGLFINQVFLMGYQQAVEHEVQPQKELVAKYQSWLEEDLKYSRLQDIEIEKLKEINQQLIDGCENGVDHIIAKSKEL